MKKFPERNEKSEPLAQTHTTTTTTTTATKTDSAIEVDRRKRDEIEKWNQMTALRFQTGGKHQTSPASLRGTVKVILG